MRGEYIKTEFLSDKPIYIGTTVLDLSFPRPSVPKALFALTSTVNAISYIRILLF